VTRLLNFTLRHNLLGAFLSVTYLTLEQHTRVCVSYFILRRLNEHKPVPAVGAIRLRTANPDSAGTT